MIIRMIRSDGKKVKYDDDDDDEATIDEWYPTNSPLISKSHDNVSSYAFMFITQEVDFEGIQETREEKVFLQTSSLFPLVLWICVYKSESNNWTDQQMWNPDVEGSLLILKRPTNVNPRCRRLIANCELINKYETQMNKAHC